MRTRGELEALLATPYSGPTKQRKGSGDKMLTYIPWQENMRVLDELVGPTNWSHEVTGLQVNTKDGVYIVSGTITLSFEEQDGTVRSISRSGVGRAVAGANKKAGEPVTVGDHDLAAAAAESDTFSRICKKFGPAFGRDLYGGEEHTSGGTDSASRATPQQGNGQAKKQGPKVGEATSAQAFRMRENGWTDEQIRSLTLEEVRAAMDGIFHKDGAPTVLPHYGGRGDEALAASMGDDFPM